MISAQWRTPEGGRASSSVAAADCESYARSSSYRRYIARGWVLESCTVTAPGGQVIPPPGGQVSRSYVAVIPPSVVPPAAAYGGDPDQGDVPGPEVTDVHEVTVAAGAIGGRGLLPLVAAGAVLWWLARR